MSSPISVAEALSLALSAQMGGAALARLDEIQQLKAAYKTGCEEHVHVRTAVFGGCLG